MSSVSRSVGRSVARSVLAGQLNNLTQIIKSIFSVGGQGFAYDPNDLTTLYQDAAGTVPVTGAGQPVGLVLDKSKGLVLGINTNVMSQWGSTIGFTYTAPNLILSNTSGGTQYPQQPILAVGKWYKVQVTCSSAVGNIKFSNQGGSTQSPVLTVGTITAYILAADANLVWSLPNNSSATITAFTAQELTGNHAYQTVSASRPLLGRHPASGARNLIHYSERSSNWTVGTGGTGLLPVKSYGAPAPDGSNTASSILLDKGAGTTTSDQSSIFFPFAYAGESSHTLTVWMKTTDGSNKKVLLDFNGVAADSGTVSLKTVTGVWQQFEIKLAAADTGRIPSLRLRGALGTDNSASLHVWHPQLEAGLIATPYQKTDARLDISENGVADAYYLAFDGVDDFLQTNAIDFTATDKVSLFAGVRRLSATSGLIIELGNDTTNNKFFLVNEYRFLARGNVVYASNQRAEKLVNVAPADAIVSAMGNVQASLNTIRINGEPGINSTAPLGSGVFINAPIYIGRRGGTSLPFNGHIYSLIGISRLTTDTETLALEKAIAKATGVMLNV